MLDGFKQGFECWLALEMFQHDAFARAGNENKFFNPGGACFFPRMLDHRPVIQGEDFFRQDFCGG